MPPALASSSCWRARGDFRPAHIGLDGSDRALDDKLDADGSREVKNHVALINKLCRDGLIMNCINRVMKARIVFEMRDVPNRAGREIIYDIDIVAPL